MNTVPAVQGRWDKVEKIASLCLQIVLITFIGSRLLFAVWWPMPAIDFTLAAVALALVIGSLRFARHSRRWRLGIIGFGAASQIIPMVCRQPILLFPVLGGLIPVGIMIGALVALSRKRPSPRPPARSC